MVKPRHGKLFLNAHHQWIFCPGNTKDVTQDIPLPDLTSTFQTLLDTGQLFRDHTKFKRVYNTHSQIQLRTSVLRHVSAHMKSGSLRYRNILVLIQLTESE